MKIIIDIPEEFESDYKGDMFKDFFSRVLCDIQDGTICGNYEKEIAEMFLKAFDESVPMNRIVEQMEERKALWKDKSVKDKLSAEKHIGTWNVAIAIVEAGGKV